MNPTLAQALVAYLHYFSILALVVTLSAELLLYRREMTPAEGGKLMKLDAGYGLASILVVATGFARALWFAKDWTFYSTNPLFWAKVGVVALWGLLSLPPTFHYLSFRANLKSKTAIAVDAGKYSKIRKFILAQMALIPLVPLLAVLMARGFGLDQ